MKVPFAFLLAATSFTSALTARDVSADVARDICGDLGLMSDQLTDRKLSAAEMANVRLCADHPLGRTRPEEGESLAPMADEPAPVGKRSLLTERKCYDKAPLGCSKGYCWKSCGDQIGQWCWTARFGGEGAWATCKSYEDCGIDDQNFGCGKGCHKADQCGCSC